MFLLNTKPNRFGIYGCFLTQNGEVVSELLDSFTADEKKPASILEFDQASKKSIIHNYQGDILYYGQQAERQIEGLFPYRTMGG